MKRLKYALAGAACALLLLFSAAHLYGKNQGAEDDAATGSGRSVCIYEDGEYALIDVEDYVVSTLAGMMSTGWNDEMLKVMAVVIRTGIYYQMDARQGAVQADYAQQKNLINETELREIRYSEDELDRKWGSCSDDISDSARAAVEATSSETITYDGEEIIPAYHLVSVGKTVSAGEIYGYDIPYLRQVDSDADKLAEDFSEVTVYTEDRLRKTFQNWLSGDAGSEACVKVTAATESGFAKKINVFGTEIDAEVFRQQLELKSTNIHIDEVDGGYRVLTVGVGDSLGLSLYGASVLAQNGQGYRDILEYYYQGTAVTAK